MITRLAPTPSGWLHLGNLCNFLLTRLWADHGAGQVLLRIDDLDRERSKSIFVDDIFHQLEWAGISWELGPQSPQEFESGFSQAAQFPAMLRSISDRLAEKPQLFYVCLCSRKDREEGKSCECRAKKIELQTGSSALFFDLGASTPLKFSNERKEMLEVPFESTPLPLIRRDGIPAYHWVSLYEDRKWKVTHVVRGQDLWESTLFQMSVEKALFPEQEIFSRANFYHHPLLTSPTGKKLSKSESSQSVLELRAQGFRREDFFKTFAQLLKLPVSENPGLNEIREKLALRWDDNQ
jgi:glutamyl/glutaminyl-tRNA synthetase